MADEQKKPFSQAVAENLIAQIKAGTAPWQRPWKAGDPSVSLPMNPTTGKRYKGINALHLMSQFRSDPRWMTYKQANAAGAQVRKGEKSTWIQYWQFTDERAKRDEAGKPYKDKDGNTVKEVYELERPRVFFAYVFNAEQIDGLPPLQAKKQEQDWQVVERAERILTASGASITHEGGDRAFYRPSTDRIHLPEKAQFPSAASYYATAMHELGHWTGHHTRLDRDLAHPFGSEGYAKEELRAEIASMILGVEMGLGHDPGQHAAYVKSWVKVLEEDHLEIFRAAADAEKIQNFVLAFEQKEVREQSTSAVLGESDEQVTRPVNEQATALDVAATEVLRSPDHTFDHFESFQGESLEDALRSRGLTTIRSVTGTDPQQFHARAIESLSPVFGIEEGHSDADNAYLERKGLASAFVTAAERLVMREEQIQSQTTAAQQGVPAVQSERGGRLVDRLQRDAVMTEGDALVTEARRDLLVSTDVSRAIDRQALSETSQKHLTFELPSNWTGEVQTRGMVHVSGVNGVRGEAVSAEELSVDPEFYGVYARTRDDDGVLTYEWLIDLPSEQQARDMAHRLALIDAHSQPNENERDARLAEIARQQFDPSQHISADVVSADAAIERIPDTWTGKFEVLSLVTVDGQPESAEALEVEPQYYGVYIELVEGNERGWAWLHSLPTEQSAVEFAARVDKVAAERLAIDKLTDAPQATTSNEKTWINVAYKEKDDAKQLGAKWERSHGEKGSWYVPAGVDLAPFAKWMPKPDTAAVTASNEVGKGMKATEAPEAVEAVQANAQPSKPASGMTLAEFREVAQAIKLENHGRQWEIFVGDRSYGFADAPESVDAIREAHHREVNNALYHNSTDAPQDQALYESLGGKPDVPSERVLADYPDLQEKFAEVLAEYASKQNIATEKTWLAIPYNQRDAAKAIAGNLPDGSRAIGWDKAENSWYAKPGADLDKLKLWLPENVQSAQGPSQSPRDEFAAALTAMGCIVEGEHPLMDGQRHRIRVEGDKAGMNGGTYLAFLPEPGARMPNGVPEIPAGYIKNHRTQLEMRWKAKGYTLTDEEKAKMHAAAAEKKQQAEAKLADTHERVSKRLVSQVASLVPVENATPYMTKKGIVPQKGALTDSDGLTVYLPACDADGKQWSMQYVNSDGSSKRFAKDSRKEGCFHVVGGEGPSALADAPVLVIGEGYATMSSAKEPLGFPTVAAFDSGNLKAVAIALHEKYPEKPVVILGDDDTHLVNNPQVRRNTGRVKAEEAAKEVGGTALFPIFAPGEQQGDPAGFTDFNDLANKSILGREGIERQVKGYVDEVIEKHRTLTNEQTQQQEQKNAQQQQEKRTRSVRM
ncbi:zincin-like metallopeptidase domain-containing protein [Burkholderia aenigmatica]|nr:zincin-like metallopeptidase domain-containing protein [Burkholderia aenigmatica]MDN7880061.1 zincin-like metallopeptidase domain-containing protein [Burkholderia aenigmatica]